jgi:hypothetical protein
MEGQRAAKKTMSNRGKGEKVRRTEAHVFVSSPTYQVIPLDEDIPSSNVYNIDRRRPVLEQREVNEKTI